MSVHTVGGWRLWADNLHGFWSFGFELYRHPAMFSRGTGPEYGAYLYFGPFRVQVSWTRRFQFTVPERTP